MNCLCGDGAYDTHQIFDSIEKLGAKPSIPPRQNAQIQQPENDLAPPLPRDEILPPVNYPLLDRKLLYYVTVIAIAVFNWVAHNSSSG